jgi:ParB family chromosome partitioning protein
VTITSCPIHIDPLTDKQMLDAVWAENYERKDISAVEQAELIQLKLQQLGPDATHATIGQEWGLSRPVISNRLGLLELPDSVKQANRDGRVSERLALALKPMLRIGELTQGSTCRVGQKSGRAVGATGQP